MELFIATLIFVIGIILIIKGGDWFVDSATWIARAAKIPAFIVGATIVGFATSLPELIVSIVGSVQGKNDMAVGNAVGSVIANTGLIMAIGLVFMTLTTPRKDYWQQCLLLVACSIVLWLGCIKGTLSLWASLIMIIICILFIAVSIQQGRRNKNAINDEIITEPFSDESKKEINVQEKVVVNKNNILKNIFLFFFGASCVILGSNLLIDGGSTIASILKVPERIIAITLVAIGTSLPELVTTVAAIRKKEGGLMAGNIIGSNIMDLTLILPICSFTSMDSFAVSKQSLYIDFPFSLVFSLIVILPILFKQKTFKWQGVLLLIGYAGYLIASSLVAGTF